VRLLEQRGQIERARAQIEQRARRRAVELGHGCAPPRRVDAAR
jgi:hypothetical protein